MERYKVIKEVGNGTFGSVWRAINKQTCEVVAIKKMKKKYYTWEECLNLREVKSLRKMNHPNIVKLKEVIRENDMLYFVFEYMECNIYQMMMNRGQKPFSEAEVRNLCFQVFQGLAYMHQRGYFHRDLKPENFLITKDMIKIADFGLAREIRSDPPYTEYVSTRWYRAPEVLLQSSVYHAAVDMWAMGAIMAELFTLRPLFPGSSEADEIEKICSVIGSPNKYSWAEGLELADAINYQFPQCFAVDLSSLIPSASENAISLIQALCSWDPDMRPTAAVALQHPFFQSCFYVPPSLRSRVPVTRTSSAGTRVYVEDRYTTKRYRAPLAYSKPPGIVPSGKITTTTTGFQQKTEMEVDKRDSIKSRKCLKSSGKQPKYRPPARSSPTSNYASRAARGVSDVADKLGNMSVATGSVTLMRQPPAPPLKAGGWHGHSDMFLGRPRNIPSSRTFSRKVAG